MQIKKIIIAHSWIDVALNLQTKQVAFKLSEDAEVLYFTQARVGMPVMKVNDRLTVMEWPNKRPTKIKDLFFAVKQMRAFKPDAVITHFGASKVMMLGSWLAGVKNRVAWYHTLSVQTRLESGGFFRVRFNLFTRWLTFLFATKVVVQTKYAAFDAVENQKIAKGKIQIIGNGLDVPVGRKAVYGYNKKLFDFLYLGRLTRSKGCEFIVHTFARLVNDHPSVILRLVGKGDAEADLKSLVEELGVTDKIIFEGGAQTYNGVFGYLQQAYALVVPSRMDNFPTVIIEAFACGLPVIASHVGGIPEMVEDGKNGFLCKLEESNDWIDKIAWMMANGARRDEMAAEARATYEAKFHLDRHVENVLAFLAGLNK